MPGDFSLQPHDSLNRREGTRQWLDSVEMPLSDDDGAPSSQDTLFLFRCLGQTRKQRQVDPELHFPHTIWFDGGEAVGEVRNDARNPQNMRLTAMKRESVSFRKARHLLKFSAGKEDNGEPAVRLCD